MEDKKLECFNDSADVNLIIDDYEAWDGNQLRIQKFQKDTCRVYRRSLLRGFETSLLSLPSSFGIARCPLLDLVLMHECAATDTAEAGVLALPGTLSRRQFSSNSPEFGRSSH
jgi:hypothetical protein